MLSEGQMRQLSEGTEATNGSIAGMLVLTSVCYAFFFMLMGGMCLFGSGGSAREPQLIERPPKDAAVATLDEMWKKQFIRKVYSLLGLQIFVTVCIASAMMLLGGEQLVLWVYGQGSWVFMVNFIALFVNLFVLMYYKTKSPHNLLLLLSFTVLMSTMIGVTCAQYAVYGAGSIVIEAFAITSLLFIGLTLFTMQSKIDFSFLGPGLFISLWVLIWWGIFASFFFTSFAMNQLFALAGVIIFSLFVVYDTHMIMNVLSYDDYIIGAINLYLDFINLFLYILRLLGGNRS